jgi:hypothetical protein
VRISNHLVKNSQPTVPPSLHTTTTTNTDAWSIHSGSCGYGQLAEDVGTGWDVAALSDAAWDYKGSCGKCKEVRCKPMGFNDGYGAWLDRTNVCYDTSASVVVMITDTCPCYYPGNAYSNKRWCCGDMYHLDLSLWAYEKLADVKWGVIAVEWRDVSCTYKPQKQAYKPWGGKSPMPDWYKPRPGWNRWQDKRLPMFNNNGRRLLRA